MTLLALGLGLLALVLVATLCFVARELVRTQHQLIEAHRERDAAVVAGGMDYDRLSRAMARHGMRISELRGHRVQ